MGATDKGQCQSLNIRLKGNECVSSYIEFKVLVGHARADSQKPKECWDLKLRILKMFAYLKKSSVTCSFIFFLLHHHERNPKKMVKISISKINICELFSYHPLIREISHWQHLKVNKFSKKSGEEFLPLAFSLFCQV